MMKNQRFHAAAAAASIGSNNSRRGNVSHSNSNNSNDRNNSNAGHNMMWTPQERILASNTGPGMDTNGVIGDRRRNNNIQLHGVPSGGAVPSAAAAMRGVAESNNNSNNNGISATALSSSKTDDIGREFDMMLGIEMDSSLREGTNDSSRSSNNDDTAVGIMEYGPGSGVRMGATADSVAGIPVLQTSNGATYGFEMNSTSVTQDKRMLGTPVTSSEIDYHYADTPTRRSNSNHHSRDVGNAGDLNNFILHGQLNSFLSDIPPPESTVSYSQMLYPQPQGRTVSNIASSNASRHSNSNSNRNNSNSNGLSHARPGGISQAPQSSVSEAPNQPRYSDQNTQPTRGQSLLNGPQNASASQKAGSLVGSRSKTPRRKRSTAKDRTNYGLDSRADSVIKASNKNGMVLDLDDQRKQFPQQSMAPMNSEQASAKRDSELASNNNNFSLRDNSRSPPSIVHGGSNTTANAQMSSLTPAAGPAGQGAETYANTNRQQIYQMTMNNNPHLINDPSIQENLSPYFTPFGIDVSHLPMTNPPIFQCSVPVYDVPVRKRRISISNGQISQLGEDIETVDDLYNTQPPPMPKLSHTNISNNNNNDNNGNAGGIQLKSQPVRPVYTQKHKDGQYQQPQGNVPAYSQPQLVSQHPSQFAPLQRDLSHTSNQNYEELDTPPMSLKVEEDEPNVNIGQDVSSSNSNVPPQRQQQQQQFVTQDISATGSEPSIQNEISGSQLYQYQLQQEQKQQTYGVRPTAQTPHQQAIYANTPVLPMSMLPTSINDPLIQSNDELTPGTKAWKKARLLERNRIAASKCRQRKKMAQLQLQKDFDKMSKENVILRKKVIYYEKLISKFKKFAETHFKTRSWSNGSGSGSGGSRDGVKVEGGEYGDELERDGKLALKVIQEMLMIDEGISEVDESGKVTKMYLDSNDYIGGGDLNVDVDVDVNTGIGTVGR